MGKRQSGQYRRRIRNLTRLLFQQLFLTFELFERNGLPNHAAAGSYCFLLSTAPVLLIISFFASRALAASPELTALMLQNSGFLPEEFNVGELINNFFVKTNSGIAGIFSGVTILFTARLCALSICRGLRVVFPASRFTPFRDIVVTLGLEFLIILFLLIILLGNRLVIDFFSLSHFSFIKTLFIPILIFTEQFVFLGSLALITLVSYRFVPAKPPKWKYIIPGTITCIVLYQAFSYGFALLIGPDRYNLIYGALGRLFLFLVNVYFFFTFFFFGAQLIQILCSYRERIFIKFRQLHSKNFLTHAPWDKLFASPPEPLKKYIRSYHANEIIFSKGSKGQEVYYILSGEAGVYLDENCQNRIALIQTANFFGEIEFLQREGRATSVKAETELSVMKLPPKLIKAILNTDPDTNQILIKSLSGLVTSANRDSLKST